MPVVIGELGVDSTHSGAAQFTTDVSAYLPAQFGSHLRFVNWNVKPPWGPQTPGHALGVPRGRLRIGKEGLLTPQHPSGGHPMCCCFLERAMASMEEKIMASLQDVVDAVDQDKQGVEAAAQMTADL
jgi:hypothetical protein